MKDDNSSMDWVEHMKFFYNSDYENDDAVINGWYNYVLKFLPTVSKEWKDKISSNKVKDKSIIFQYVTISDEALVRWLVELWLPKLKILVDNNWIEDDKKKSHGPHDTKQFKGLYSIIHSEISTSRKDHKTAIRWNTLFWNEVERRNKHLFCDQTKFRKKNKQYCDNIIPLPDMNEEEDFWTHYSTSSSKLSNVINPANDDTKLNTTYKPEQIVSGSIVDPDKIVQI